MDQIKEVLSREVGSMDINGQIQLLSDLRMELARIAEIKTRANYELIKARKKALDKVCGLPVYKSMKEADKKIYLQEGCIEEEIKLYEIEIINKEIHYAIEATRTIISALKAEKEQYQ